MAQHAIYTSVTQDHYLYYERETLDIDMMPYGMGSGQPYYASNQTGEASTIPVSQQWACADGATNCYVIDRDSWMKSGHNTKTFTIDLEHVPFVNSGSTSFKVVTLGHLTRMSEYGWVAYPYYFKSACSELAFKHKKEFPAEFADIVDGEVDEESYTKWELYDYYTSVSDTFSYISYPTYRQQVNANGDAFSQTPLDFQNVAAQVQDYDMHQMTGGEQQWRTGRVVNDAQMTVSGPGRDQSVIELTSLLNGEGTFFGFITAAISVLPSWFMTILSAFFVTLLAVVVIKFLI